MKSIINNKESLKVIIYVVGFMLINIILFSPFLLVPLKILFSSTNVASAFSERDLYSLVEMPSEYQYVFWYFIVSFIGSLLLFCKNSSSKITDIIKGNKIFGILFSIICLLNIWLGSITASLPFILLIIFVVIITIISSYVLLLMFVKKSLTLLKLLK